MSQLKRILLVEDDARDVELTLLALGEYKLANKVDVVNDGEQALDYLLCRGSFANRQTPPPAVVLLDLKMPKVDGLQVLRAIRADPDLRLMPVVILTSSREERDLVEGYSLGVNAYVVKPVDFHQFLDAIRQIGIFWALVNEAPPLIPDGGKPATV